VIHSHIHLSIWLISRHRPENSRTNRTLCPVFFSNEILKTADVEFMRTCEHIHIVFILFVQFIKKLFFSLDLKFTKANGALFFLHFTFGQIKLKRRKVLKAELLLDFSCIVFVLFVCEENIGLNLLVMFFSWLDNVSLVKLNFKTIVILVSNFKCLPLLILEHVVFILLRLLLLLCFLLFRIFIKEFEQIHRTNFIKSNYIIRPINF
jgi:hypothetical protein